MSILGFNPEIIPQFNRDYYDDNVDFCQIGNGSIGGKAKGLAFVKDKIKLFYQNHPVHQVTCDIPRLVVITTEFFDQFMEGNNLYETALLDLSNERMAHHFLKADLPVNLIGDLWAMISAIHTPLAIRSSSLLEDSLHFPFAGVYETKMIPNNEADINGRFHRLIEAIKFVYSSTFFSGAKNYMKSIGKKITDEKMAVIIQEVVGKNHNKRFYPHISGIAKSYNFYPFGHALPHDGMVSLAVGLGKTIVDDGKGWTYSPPYPGTSRPFGSTKELLKETQNSFWAVNMDGVAYHDPCKETEYLLNLSLVEAEYDTTLDFAASTYDYESDMIRPGMDIKGPRIITFEPVLKLDALPINQVVHSVLTLCEEVCKTEVEIEFAITIDSSNNNFIQVRLLQVRPMAISQESIDINLTDLQSQDVLLASNVVMGNGSISTIKDIVFIDPSKTEQKYTQDIVAEIAALNQELVNQGLSYLLIGFGRFGSSDPWLGIPVKWEDISGARAIVEYQLSTRNIEWSQGSHFFHNMSNLGVLYFSVSDRGMFSIDWPWLLSQQLIQSGTITKHVRTQNPILVLADGRTREGVIKKWQNL